MNGWFDGVILGASLEDFAKGRALLGEGAIIRETHDDDQG
jgi:hypothetical protein